MWWTYQGIEGEMWDWTMEEFISTTFSANRGIVRDHRRLDKEHQTPTVEWEILHPKLPILRITAHTYQTKEDTDQTLPLQLPDGRDWEGDTSYSVSFVMSIQHRWESF